MTVWITLIAVAGTLAAGLIGAWAVLRGTRARIRAQELRDLDSALSEYFAAVVKAVAMLSRLPDLAPDHPAHKFSDAWRRGKDRLLGPSLSWVQTEVGLRRVLGDQAFAPAERVVDAAARLRVLNPGPEMATAIDHASDYLIALGQRRTEDILGQWPGVHAEITTAIEAARQHARR